MSNAGTSRNSSVLDRFHPLVAAWFREEVGDPTAVQQQAWPLIGSGGHALISAPTGTGKTLAAFLTAIDERLRGGTGRVLYISPLKALNYDIQRNLNAPLAALRRRFDAAGEEFPRIRVGVRSGDTEQAERRRLISDPPEILVTTPESLNLMLSSKNGLRGLAGFSVVILDEIHAVLSSKRGVYLMSAVERLTRISGEFQRLALSATVAPLELVAEILGGFRPVGNAPSLRYEPRRIETVSVTGEKRYDLEVAYPEAVGSSTPEERPTPTDSPALTHSSTPADRDRWWEAVVAELLSRIRKNRSTLIFANSRRMVEKLARLLNDAGDEPVYAHHGSLSREVRRVVEERLKAGELRGIVATSSLELGIDIGSIDEVILVQAPFTISAAVQRIGRAGHGVGARSRGTFLPIHPRDLLESTPLIRAIREQAVEPVTPPERPLDVLAQIVVSTAITGPVYFADLLALLNAVHAYRNLRSQELELVVEMLAGKYADTRIRELNPRVSFDRASGRIEARKNAAMLLYMSGGVIPDRGYFNLKNRETNGKIGELDEEFVWERSPGDAFPFGNRAWRITGITNNDVFVVPAARPNSVVPFWRAEEQNRPYLFSSRIGEFLEEAEGKLPAAATDESPELTDYLRKEYRMAPAAAAALAAYLARQRGQTGALPHRRRLLLERCREEPGGGETTQLILHTFWGGAVNKPLALVVAALFRELYSFAPEVYANNDALLINLPTESASVEIFSLLRGKELPRLLRESIEGGGVFGAHFRENAQRALLLPRKSFKERMPLWLNRLRAQKLLQATAEREDFPITLETWRECMQTEFDLPRLQELLDKVWTGEITVAVADTANPSPFAESIIWRQTNVRMYQDDTAPSQLRTSLSDELLEEILHSPHLRPELPGELVLSFRQKLHRTAPGYPPTTVEELRFWLEERLMIPVDEWEELLTAIRREGGGDVAKMLTETDKAMLTVTRDGRLHSGETPAERLGFAADANRELLTAAFSRTAEGSGEETEAETEPPLHGFLRRWLQFYGPLPLSAISSRLPVDDHVLERGLAQLSEEGSVLIDRFTVGAAEAEVCNRENLEGLLRLRRAAARPDIEPMDTGRYQWFLARRHGIARPGNSMEDLEGRLEQLFGYPAAAELWEREILPARLDPYYPSSLDAAMAESDLLWLGVGTRRITFGFEEELDLFFDSPAPEEEPDSETSRRLASALGELRRARLFELPGEMGLKSEEVTDALWELVWKGRATNDTMEALRSGIRSGFRPEKPGGDGGTSRNRRRPAGDRRRGGYSRWRASRPSAGSWFLLTDPEPPEDPLDEAELLKERARLLIDRYGILFRELLARELPALGWGRLFRTLRSMELSGELVTGQFVTGVRGLQFAPPELLGELQKEEEESVYRLNAADPVSLCGAGLPGELPRRLPSTHLIFCGSRLVLTSRRSGRDLNFAVGPDHPRIGEYLESLAALLSRREAPWKRLRVETLNKEKPRNSSYGEALRRYGFVADGPYLTLYRRY